jgi:hypothetical protein
LKDKSTDELLKEFTSWEQRLKTVLSRLKQTTLYSDEWRALTREQQRIDGRLSVIETELFDPKPSQERKKRDKIERAKRREQKKAAKEGQKRRAEKLDEHFEERIRKLREELSRIGEGSKYQAEAGLTQLASDGPVVQDEPSVSGQTSPSAILDCMEDNKVEQTQSIQQHEETDGSHVLSRRVQRPADGAQLEVFCLPRVFN